MGQVTFTPRRRMAASCALAGAVFLAGTVASTALAAAPAVPARAAAPSAPSVPLAPASPDLPGLPQVSGALHAVEVDSPDFRRAAEGYDAANGQLGDVQQRRLAGDRASTTASAARASARTRLAAASARIDATRQHLDVIEGAINDLAVRMFIDGGPAARANAALTDADPSINDHDRRAVLGTASIDVLLAERAAYIAHLEEAQARASAARGDLQAADEELGEASSRRADLVTSEQAEATTVSQARVELEVARVLAEVTDVDFPLVALDAYHRAAATTAEDDPGCGVRWWALAGISKVEGRHGTYGGSALDAEGNTTRRIIGIQLNGSNATASIPDSDGGALDGDPHFDRAIGPMQFIPQTWRRFAADGDDNGEASPFNLYDATLAAARYLCHGRSGLDGDAGLRAAYFSYNHSLHYVDSVLTHARSYERALDLPHLARAR